MIGSHVIVVGETKVLAPGLALALTVAFAATHLSEHYGAPVMLFALLIGLALHFLYADGVACGPGIEFAAKRLLRIGVALLGLQISVDQILTLGLDTLAIVVGGTVLTIVFGMVAARLAGRSMLFGLLTGGAVGICGASAAIAIGSVLTTRRVSQADVMFTVAAVTTLSTVAMIVYPILAARLGLDERTIGILFGATIHDVAQVVGAGYAISDTAGNIATTVKLFRVALLVPVVVLISLCTRTDETRPARGQLARVPGFAIAFAILVGVGSLDVIPAPVHEVVSGISRWFLVTAISALGIMTSLKAMADLGTRHLAIVVAETLWLLGIVVLAVCILPS